MPNRNTNEIFPFFSPPQSKCYTAIQGSSILLRVICILCIIIVRLEQRGHVININNKNTSWVDACINRLMCICVCMKTPAPCPTCMRNTCVCPRCECIVRRTQLGVLDFYMLCSPPSYIRALVYRYAGSTPAHLL